MLSYPPEMNQEWANFRNPNYFPFLVNFRKRALFGNHFRANPICHNTFNCASWSLWLYSFSFFQGSSRLEIISFNPCCRPLRPSGLFDLAPCGFCCIGCELNMISLSAHLPTGPGVASSCGAVVLGQDAPTARCCSRMVFVETA